MLSLVSAAHAALAEIVSLAAFTIQMDGKRLLKDMQAENYRLVTGFSVTKIISKNGKAVAVEGIKAFQKQRFSADKIILAAGGIVRQ